MKTRGKWTFTWWKRSRRGACWTGWWATRFRRCLWDKVRRGLSAGRVQTVALRVIVEREREIRAFEKREYWTIDVGLGAKKPPNFEARLIRRAAAGAEAETPEIGTQQAAEALVNAVSGAEYVVKSVGTREKRRNPVAPFITSTLQQEAARKLRFSVKRTMMLAQRLYEGIELGKEGATGLITYMRTDSTRVSDEAIEEVRGFISRQVRGGLFAAGAERLQDQERGAGRARSHPADIGDPHAGRRLNASFPKTS